MRLTVSISRNGGRVEFSSFRELNFATKKICLKFEEKRHDVNESEGVFFLACVLGPAEERAPVAGISDFSHFAPPSQDEFARSVSRNHLHPSRP